MVLGQCNKAAGLGRRVLWLLFCLPDYLLLLKIYPQVLHFQLGTNLAPVQVGREGAARWGGGGRRDPSSETRAKRRNFIIALPQCMGPHHHHPRNTRAGLFRQGAGTSLPAAKGEPKALRAPPPTIS